MPRGGRRAGAGRPRSGQCLSKRLEHLLAGGDIAAAQVALEAAVTAIQSVQVALGRAVKSNEGQAGAFPPEKELIHGTD